MRNACLTALYAGFPIHRAQQSRFPVSAANQIGRHGERVIQTHRVLRQGRAHADNAGIQVASFLRDARLA